MDFREYFKNKKITVMGLGLLGRGVGDIAFLAQYAKELIVTDLKPSTALRPSLAKLRKFKNITYHLGGHRLKDFNNVDLIIKAAGVPVDSPYIIEARKNNIPVEMSTSLFAKLSPATLIGITGTRGKSTVTHLIYEILKSHLGLNHSFRRTVGRNTLRSKVFLGGNVRGVATLPLLKKVRKGDYAVLELDSWQLQGFGENNLPAQAGISPHIAVFTTFMEDHLNYYKNNLDMYLLDKAQIFLHQKKDDYLVLGESVKTLIKKQYGNKIKGKIISPSHIPLQWNIPLLGEHNKENISLAIAVAKVFGIQEKIIKNTVEKFKGVPGRMELIRTYKGIRIYNDTTATTPQATLAALKALGSPSTSTSAASGSTVLSGSPSKDSVPNGSGQNQNIVLILGGADKGIDMGVLLKEIPRYCKALILLPGTGTDRILPQLRVTGNKLQVNALVHSLKEAVKIALTYAQISDIILLSPAFASFGLFRNEYDRGDKFVNLVKGLK